MKDIKTEILQWLATGETGISSEAIAYQMAGIENGRITEHYNVFLYEPKSICAFQIRRNNKKYDDNVLVNTFMNEPNRMTYFLIRNGTNIYRIWSNVHISNRLFPSETEYRDLLDEKKNKDWWDKNHATEEVKKQTFELFIWRYCHTGIS